MSIATCHRQSDVDKSPSTYSEGCAYCRCEMFRGDVDQESTAVLKLSED